MPETKLSPRVLVRPARKDEARGIGTLVAAALQEFRELIPPAIFQAYVEESADIAARWDEAEVLVAEIEGELAGTVSFYADASREGLGFPATWAGFRTLAVDPAMRGRGIGKVLLQTCLDKARTQGAPTLAIHTSQVMRAARLLYEQAGFRRSPEHDVTGSAALGLDEGAGHIAVIAYRLDFASAT
jgi:GNAT superfamily N-acetyltransferase